MWFRSLIAALLAMLTSLCLAETAASPDVLYQQHCARCHGAERTGAMGPALLPESLSRLKPTQAHDIIKSGRPSTQMPAFGTQLSDAQIQLLVDFIYKSPTATPQWTLADINASQILHVDPTALMPTPQFKANLENLFIVVELGDHHATLLDGDIFEPIHRFPTRYALHGGPKYSPDGRFVYFASRDGWISKFDIYNLKTVSEIRVALNTRNLAVSFDGRYAIAANYLPQNLVLLDADTLEPLQILETGSRVSAVYTAPPRNSFIAAMKDLKEVWEIAYQPGIAVRRIPADDYLDDFFFDQEYTCLIGASRDGEKGEVIELASGRKIAELPLGGMPHLGSGISFDYRGKPVLATPHLNQGKVSIIDMERWRIIKQVETLGPGFFMRSHDASPYAWVDVFLGSDRDAVHVIDKATLAIKETLRPAPGKTAAHVEFTQDGRFALLSIWDDDGAIVVYDSHTLKEIKRIPMKKPSGKYNVFNKTRYRRGTSH